MSDGQIDLFLETMVNAPVKDERSLMEFPFFSLTKQKRTKPFVYDDSQVKIEIEPHDKFGMATIWDKDLIIYCASIINERIERGAELPDDRTIHISAHDFLTVTGRGTGKRSYELMLDALDRLNSTVIKTTITSGHNDERERRGFNWIDSYRVIERTTGSGRKIMAAVEIVINKWMWRGLVEDRRVLSIDRAYFRLTKGLERRLYELARKHCGRQTSWRVKLPRLAEKCGSDRHIRNFKIELNTIIKRDSLPQYDMALSYDTKRAGALREDGYQVKHVRNKDILVIFTPKPGAFSQEILPPVD